MSHRVWGGTGSLPYGGLGASIRPPRSAAASLRVFGLRTCHWHVRFTASLSRSSSLPARAIKKRLQRGLRPLEHVVEVRRVELLSTTANREVSPGSVGSQSGERSVKRQTSRTPAGSILACGIPATSASAIPLNDLAPAPGIERRIEGAELN